MLEIILEREPVDECELREEVTISISDSLVQIECIKTFGKKFELECVHVLGENYLVDSWLDAKMRYM